MNIKNPSWLKVMLEWLFLATAVGVSFGGLASGYSMTLPVIGVVPGPPSPAVARILIIAFIACLSTVVVFAIPVLVSGSWGKRIVGGLPLLAVMLMVGVFVYGHYQ